MPTTNTQQSVVVTGATGGIGMATCLRLAQDGYDIIGQYASRSGRATAITDEIRETGRDANFIQADLTDIDQVSSFVNVVSERLTGDGAVPLKGLVNNAAKLVGPSFESTTPVAFDNYFALNVKAPFFLAQLLAKLMGRGSSIINVSSMSTRFSSGGDIVYAMSKSSLEALTFHAAEHLAERGIRINTVLPGFTDNGHPAFADAAVKAHMASYSVMEGIANPDEVAAAISFLMSDAASRTTGSVLDVSGGGALGARRGGGSLTDLIR